jgi:hypothetical protein
MNSIVLVHAVESMRRWLPESKSNEKEWAKSIYKLEESANWRISHFCFSLEALIIKAPKQLRIISNKLLEDLKACSPPSSLSMLVNR